MKRRTKIAVTAMGVFAVAVVSSFGVMGDVSAARVVSKQETEKKRNREAREKPKTEATSARDSLEGEATGPMLVFADIERGWNANDVEGILKHFGGSKVSISIEAGPSGGQFSKSQSFYLLKDLFKYTITKKFEFVQYRKPSENGRSSFAVAERLYQKTDDGRLFKDKIYVSLHAEEGGQWVVSEIKSIR